MHLCFTRMRPDVMAVCTGIRLRHWICGPPARVNLALLPEVVVDWDRFPWCNTATRELRS